MSQSQNEATGRTIRYDFPHGPIIIDLDEEDSASDATLENDGTEPLDAVEYLNITHLIGNQAHERSSEDSSHVELETYERHGMHLRPNKTVELRDGDFLRILSIQQHRYTHEITLHGHRFRRNSKIYGLLEKKMNEVTWLVNNQMSPFTVHASEAIMIRQLFLTNELYPARSFRDNPDARHRRWKYILEQERLVCRWKLFSKTSPYETLVDYRDSYLLRLEEWECTVEYNVDNADLRRAYRGPSPKGGSCRAWLEGEKRFDEQERRDCHQRDPLHFYASSLPAPDQLRYTFGDAFCGAGGSSRGAKGAGLRVSWGFDWDPAAIESYMLNFYNVDYRVNPAHEFATQLTESLKVDVLHMSPPCQTFSPAHVRAGKNDEINESTFLAVGSILEFVKPRVVTLEETDGLVKLTKHREHFHALIHMFTSRSYSVRWKVFNLVEFGLPQRRKRLFLFASCPGEACPDFPSPTHCDATDFAGRAAGRQPFLTVNRAISQLPLDGHLHHPLSEALQTFKHPYDGDAPYSHTICCAGAVLHPSGLRNCTIREVACLQGFPHEHKFGETGVRKHIGNAVPPVVAKAFFMAVIKALRKADGLPLE